MCNGAQHKSFLEYLNFPENATTVRIMEVIKYHCDRGDLRSYIFGVIPLIRGMESSLTPNDEYLRRAKKVIERLRTGLESSVNLARARKRQCPMNGNCSDLTQSLTKYFPS